MEAKRYQVILTGELLPGFSRDTAVAMMAEIFHASPQSIRTIFDDGNQPVDGEFAADDALDLQKKLERIGVSSRIERTPSRKLGLQLRDDGLRVEGESGLMYCPACGREQQVSERCVSCGILFRDYARNQTFSPQPGGPAAPRQPVPAKVAPGAPQRSARPEGQAAPPPPPPAGSRHAEENWREAWGGFEEVDNEPDEMADLALFFGADGQRFLKMAERIVDGPRNRFVIGWVWGAVLSPFLWTLHRKMWGLSAVVFFAEILLPVALITFGTSPSSGPNKWAYLGYLGLLANRVFWPAVLDYLYCLHARASVTALHRMSQSRATDIGIAKTGGSSIGSVFVGVSVASVLTLIAWSVVDSVRKDKLDEIDQRIVAAANAPDVTEAANPDHVTGVGELMSRNENKWVVTRKKLRTLGQHVNGWLSGRVNSNDAGQLSLFQLREDTALRPDAMRDAWDNEIQYIPDNEGYRLISAGPDHLFGTADDIQYRRILAN